MSVTEVVKDIYNVGAKDDKIDLFESQYPVPKGITYNSYIIKDEKNVIIDTVDARKTNEWLKNIGDVLKDQKLDYLFISHLEPDHSGSIEILLEKYPKMKVVSNAKVFSILPQFIKTDLENRTILVTEGEMFSIGKHNFKFIMAPMVHWPEVMFEYEITEKILFSADAFGTFGIVDEKSWISDSRRYYFNIVGKYGAQVQTVLKKAAGIDIKTICPLHGPVLKDKVSKYMRFYDIWSRYEPEKDGYVIVYASIHGNTKAIAESFAKKLKERGEKSIVVHDITRESLSYAISDAFRFDKLVLASSTYNMQLFPPMESFIEQLKSKNFQNRKIAIIENGTWAPNAAKCIKDHIKDMKNITLIEPVVTVKTKLNKDSIKSLNKLLDNIVK